MLLKLKNGGIVNIQSDEYSYRGCPTCDYGSQYINEVTITLTKYVINVNLNKMYEYCLSSGSLMTIILPNVDLIMSMTEEEFIKWFKEQLQEIIDKSYAKLNYTWEEIK